MFIVFLNLINMKKKIERLTLSKNDNNVTKTNDTKKKWIVEKK